MTNRELHELLKRVDPPSRDAFYWESFPNRVQSRLPKRGTLKPIFKEQRHGFHFWNIGFAAAGTAIALFLIVNFTRSRSNAGEELRVLRNCYRETAGLFSGQLKAIKIESGTLHVELSEKPDVPDSAP